MPGPLFQVADRSAKRIQPSAWALGVLVGVVASAAVAWSSPIGIDYLAPPCDPDVCDDAGPSIAALSHADLHGFFANQPPMGSFSLLLRAPTTAIAHGASDLAVYRLGVFVCLLAAGLLAVYLAGTMARRSRPWTFWAIVPAACIVNPVTYQAAYYGHPEEVLGAALAVGAVLAAGRRRWVFAGILLGCAIATKQWAALAVIPALIAAPAGTRLRLAATCALLVAALTVPMVVGDAGRFQRAQERVSVATAYTNTVTATNVWWPFASRSTGPGVDVNGRGAPVTQYSLSGGVGRLSHLGVIALALALSLLYAARRGRGDPEAVLELLALLFLLRCLLDPLAFSYHHVPFVVALVSYEALRRRLPLMSVVAVGALLLMNEVIAPTGEPALINAFYLLWTLPLAGAMALSLFAPSRLEAIGRRFASPAARSDPGWAVLGSNQ